MKVADTVAPLSDQLIVFFLALKVFAAIYFYNKNNMSFMDKARSLKRRGFTSPKNRCDESKLLLLSGSNSDLSLVERNQIFSDNPLPRSSSMNESCFPHLNTTNNNDDSNCTISSCDRCSYSGIVAQVSDGVRPCLPSPTLMRRRNAICDELEKRMISLPGRTLRQRRVDMLRGIALTEFSLL